MAPDGSRLYISNEADNTLDFVDAKTLKVTKKVTLSGHPNNLAVGRDGRRVYIGIREPEPGGVDVVDTASFKMVKTIPTQGAIHNAYVTPDGKYVVAGSISGETINVIDAQTEKTAWTLKMDLGVRPMTFVDQSRRIDEVDLRADERPEWICGRGFRDAQGNQAHRESRRCHPARRRCPKGRIPLTAWRSPRTARRSSSAAD